MHKTLKEFILSKALLQEKPIQDTTSKLLGSSKSAVRLRRAVASPDSNNRAFKSTTSFGMHLEFKPQAFEDP